MSAETTMRLSTKIGITALAAWGVLFGAAPVLRAQCVEAPVNTWTCTGADVDGLDATTNGSPDTIDVQPLATLSNGGNPAVVQMIDGVFGNQGSITHFVDLGTAVYATSTFSGLNSGAGTIVCNGTATASFVAADGVLQNSGAAHSNSTSDVAIFMGGGGDVVNEGTASARGLSGVAILTGTGDNTVTQRGIAIADAGDGIAILTDTGADTVELDAGSSTTGGNSSPFSLCTPLVRLAVCTGDDNDSVDVEETATVDGVIDGGAGTDTLTFHFLTPADLAGQTPASGTVTHDGLTYSWRNFEALQALQTLVSIGDVTQAEGTGGSTTFTFLLTRSGDLTAGSVLVSTVDGTAVSPGDFASQTNVLVSFSNGQPSATFDVTVVADPGFEPDEGFQVVLSSPTNMEIADGTGDGTILNDDALSVTEIPALGSAGRILLVVALGAVALFVLRRAGMGA